MKSRPPASSGRDEYLELVLVRHGHALGGPMNGNPKLGAGLTALGRRQAARVAKRLARERFDRIYSSDATRAHETAQAIVKHHRRTPFALHREFREIMTYHNRGDRRPPKGSRPLFLRQRKSLDAFLPRFLRRHRPGQRVLLVCHGQLIQFLISYLAGVNPRRSVPIHIHNTAVTQLFVHLPQGRLMFDRGVGYANCVKHLLPSQQT